MFNTPINIAARHVIVRSIWNYSSSPTYEDYILIILWLYLKLGRATVPAMKSLIQRLIQIITEWEESGRCTVREDPKDMPTTTEAPVVANPHQDGAQSDSTTAMLGGDVPVHPEAWITQLCKRKRCVGSPVTK